MLEAWFATLSTIELICRDSGHWWPPEFQPGETYKANEDGSYAISAFCVRGCKIRRTRFVGAQTFYLDKASVYDYSQNPRYKIPQAILDWSGTKDLRALIRAEIQRRADAGEDVYGALSGEVDL